MKFMIVNKPTGHSHDMDATPAEIRKHAAGVKELMDNGTIEDAWVLLSGGHVYIANADTSEELVAKVRYNPLFHKSNTEIWPIEDAVGYLEGYAAHLESAG